MDCPRCGADRRHDAPSAPRCGVLVRKARPRARPRAPRRPPGSPRPFAWRSPHPARHSASWPWSSARRRHLRRTGGAARRAPRRSAAAAPDRATAAEPASLPDLGPLAPPAARGRRRPARARPRAATWRPPSQLVGRLRPEHRPRPGRPALGRGPLLPLPAAGRGTCCTPCCSAPPCRSTGTPLRRGGGARSSARAGRHAGQPSGDARAARPSASTRPTGPPPSARRATSSRRTPDDPEAARALAYALVRQDRTREAIERPDPPPRRPPGPGGRRPAGADPPRPGRRGRPGRGDALAHFHVRYDGDAHEDVGARDAARPGAALRHADADPRPPAGRSRSR